MTEKKLSNYERMCLEWAQRLKSVDMQAVMRRLPEIEYDGSAYTIRHFRRKLAMDGSSFLITAPEDSRPVSIDEKLNYYTLMWYCTDGAQLTGEWKPFTELKNASPFGPAFKRGILEPFAETFSGNLDRLAEAAKTLGAKKLEMSDCGFELNAFECIPIRCFVWDADEEFIAQANMLFDKSAVDFIHVESVVTIAQRCLVSLAEVSGLKLKGNTFSQE